MHPWRIEINRRILLLPLQSEMAEEGLDLRKILALPLHSGVYYLFFQLDIFMLNIFCLKNMWNYKNYLNYRNSPKIIYANDQGYK